MPTGNSCTSSWALSGPSPWLGSGTNQPVEYQELYHQAHRLGHALPLLVGVNTRDARSRQGGPPWLGNQSGSKLDSELLVMGFFHTHNLAEIDEVRLYQAQKDCVSCSIPPPSQASPSRSPSRVLWP